MKTGPRNHSSLDPKDRLQESQTAFLQDLTSIANQHGLGINEDSELFVMEVEDFSFRYSCDSSGRLLRL